MTFGRPIVPSAFGYGLPQMEPVVDPPSPPAEVIRFIKALPYGRASDRRPETILREGRGTCSGKHYLLAAWLRDLRVDCALVQRVYRVSKELTQFGEATAGLPAIGVVDVHTFARVLLPNGWRRIDVTFPGQWDGESHMELACGTGQDFSVPAGEDPQRLKDSLILQHCDREMREAWIAALSRAPAGR